jgi:hypothetical protein
MIEIICEHTLTVKPKTWRIAPSPPNLDAILARLPLPVVTELVDILAGRQNSPETSVNATRCIQAVLEHISPREEIAVYEWAHEIQRDLGEYGGLDAPAETPYTEVLWECTLAMASPERTAQFIHDIAAGLCRKAEEVIQ